MTNDTITLADLEALVPANFGNEVIAEAAYAAHSATLDGEYPDHVQERIASIVMAAAMGDLDYIASETETLYLMAWGEWHPDDMTDPCDAARDARFGC